MPDALGALATVTAMLRLILLFGAAAMAGIAALDWAVRTRRISPFSGIARFVRLRVEPRFTGIERTVLRAGGSPSSTPWWALLVYVVSALLILAAADTLTGILAEVVVATRLGARGVLVLLIRWTFAFLRLALLVRVIASWIPGAAHRRWVGWSFGATEWMLRPLRRLIPTFGVVDLSPLVAYFALGFVQWLVESTLLVGR